MTATLADWRNAGKGFAHHSHSIFYRDEGQGDRALLLIHGFPTASWDWHRVWPVLRLKFPRLIAPDMIGFGFSAKPRRYDYSIFDQADLIETLLERCGIGRVHILAHDYGDTVAQELLARHVFRHEKADLPKGRGGALWMGQIGSCCLLNGGLFPETHRARLVQKLLLTPLGPLLGRAMSEASFGRSFAAIFGPNTQPSAQELHEFWQLFGRDGAAIAHKLIRYIPERRAHRERWVGALQKTKVPLRVIDGPVDPVSGQHMVDRYRELVPNPDAVTLPGIGHYPQVEDPQGVMRAFLEFHAARRGVASGGAQGVASPPT